jgi:hypothetical protein
MAEKKFPKSQLPIRQTSKLLPTVFQTPANEKFMEAVIDPLVQPGLLEKTVGYIGRRYGKTYRGSDVYLDSDATLRSRYQLEPGVTTKTNEKVNSFYDYIDFKNQIKFFGNPTEQDSLTTDQEHYSWSPPIDWDKFINYREYYWVPSGPPPVPVLGNLPSIATSSYQVVLGIGSSFIFRPDGFTNNPTLTLYRGHTYKFKVNAPREGFVIRTNYDTGSLIYNSNKTYEFGDLSVYDGKLWRALGDVPPNNIPGAVSETIYWEFIEISNAQTALDYNKGITNNGTENGTVTFEVPFDAPDLLYYQSKIDPDRFGKFIIADIESNTSLEIDKEILGKLEYTSSNGIKFSNGLLVEFPSRVVPEKYSQDVWIVDGVGTGIRLIRFGDLEVPNLDTDFPEVLFDNSGFDAEPFDDAKTWPGFKDYITINRSSIDSNPWSRYNRWFHRSVLEYAYKIRNDEFPATEAARAKRPIIEFLPNIQLFNHGSNAKQAVDYVEDYTTDVFSTIEGSDGYIVDGEPLFNGARILIIADTDSLANNKIYEVKFIVHNNRTQITLVPTEDTLPVAGDCLLVRRGKNNASRMYHFTGVSWVKSQEKTNVNQPPIFDAFDENAVSFSDPATYPINNFKGTKLFSYKPGNGITDSELGFKLSYLNIDNVGDIEFDWNWGSDSFLYTKDQILTEQSISQGYFKFNPNDDYQNGWIKTDNKYIQPIIDSYRLDEDSQQVILTTVEWDRLEEDSKINFYLNGVRFNTSYQRQGNTFIFENTTFVKNDVVSVKVITKIEPRDGYYEIPVGLERNPLNQEVRTFTLGQAADHVLSAVEFVEDFEGVIPGISNLRDITDYRQYSKRFMKHQSLVPLSISLLCDKNTNIVKSLQFVKKSYTDFKNNFLNRSVMLPFNDNIPDFVDEILSDMSRAKTQENAFADSDMIGTGAFTSIDYEVEDEGIRTFSLSERFTLSEPSRRAVYVYINGDQLLNGIDYQFNDTFGFVTILKEVELNDKIQIREYVSTTSSFIPATPTKLGLYKKYTPSKFVDDTYRDPREVIQGHDGSLTFTFGDFRDDLLLELEYRIYNNIKQEYSEDVFDIDSVIGGYYGNSQFNKSAVDQIANQEFLKWIQNTDVNYTINSYLAETDTFTYTYSNMTDPTGRQNLPGWWRGVYQWFYDTDRPHRCPWEILGFSQQPDWWESEYGPAPYTRNNLILWEDIRDGIVRQGSRAGRYERYARPSILDHIPVDGDGNLLSPLDSGLAGNFVLINNKGNFNFGDVSPVEYAWRSSSEWPYSVMIALSLLKPFDFIPVNFDRTRVSVNRIGQAVNAVTRKFIQVSDLEIPSIDKTPSAGLVNYLVDYAKSRRSSLSALQEKISTLDVSLSSRLSGFVDKAQHRYLLDSKNPRSTSGSVFVPPENYDIIFNVSSPVTSLAYSGVIVEKTEGGWFISGYDSLKPYFSYYEAAPNQKDPVITVGGVSETFVEWEPGKIYNNGQIVKYKNDFYRAIKTHTSSDEFELSQWKKLPNIPLVGGIEARRRRNFNTLVERKISYGTKLTSIQAVVDFLLGYEQYLKYQGFSFEGYDTENQVSQDWTTSAKEFMFWTKHNWAIGALITLSPAASSIAISVPVGVVENLLDSFYDYQVFKSDGAVLDPKFLNVKRSFQKVVVETTNTTDGIYFLRLHYVLKEHVALFTDRTVFNDVIYDKPTGYRQERIKTQGFRTTDWDGDYTSPGFLFDNVNIDAWQPFTDYKLGDIVEYQSRYWTSQENQLGAEIFDDTKWSRLDSTPSKQLVANFDYRINQFDDYYEVASEGIGQSQRDLARHAIGYQDRYYLQELAEDPVTQFQLYQGFIREKGTINSITKVFDKLSTSGEASITLDEEWAFRIGQFGGVDQLREIEFGLSKDRFFLNPQPLIVANDYVEYPDDQYYRISKGDFTIEPIPFTTDVNLVDYESAPFKTAGYAKADQVDFIIKNKTVLESAVVDVSPGETFEGLDTGKSFYFWVTFDGPSWTVLRLFKEDALIVESVQKSSTTVTVSMNTAHGFVEGDYIGFTGIANLTGFYKVTGTGVDENDSTLFTVSVEVPTGSSEPELDESTIPSVCRFTEVKFKSYKTVDQSVAALLPNGSKIWIDNNGLGQWEHVRKQSQYSPKRISNYGGLERSSPGPQGTGKKVIYDDVYKLAFASIPESGYVMSYADSGNTLPLRNIIESPLSYRNDLNGSFGTEMALSPDSTILVVGAPLASNLPHNSGSNVNGTVPILSQEGTGDDYDTHGSVFIYRRQGQSWILDQAWMSPEPTDNEKFGSAIAIGQYEGRYVVAISAPGADNDSGKVYMFEYVNSAWKRIEDPLFADSTSLVSEGDLYGASLSMNKDATILVVGAPQTNKVVDNKGRVFVFQESAENNSYEIKQVIDFETLPYIDDSDSVGSISSGDQFGFAVSLDDSGHTLAISAPEGDIFNQDQGSVYILTEVSDSSGISYRVSQKINSYQNYFEERFGQSIAIVSGLDGNATGVVVGASNNQSAVGAVYVFEVRDEIYFLTEKLSAELSSGESFGFSVDAAQDTILVGSPNYKVPVVEAGVVTYPGEAIGTIRVFKKQPNVSPWQIVTVQEESVNIGKVKSIALYDTINNQKIKDVDYVDHAKLKVLNIAEKEITFKTPYDPAVYSLGVDEEKQTISADIAWTSQNVGKLWWDLSTVKWITYEQGDTSYRSGNWNTLAEGASVDIYEWIETPLLPSEWSALADTNEGLAENISGQPLYPNDNVYSIKELFNDYNGLPTQTLYYYWVKNTVIVPNDVLGRSLSAKAVADLITDPKGSNESFISLISKNEFLAYNFAPVVTKTGTVLNIQYYKDGRDSNLIHNEYQLLTSGVADSLPTKSLESKWIDSLVGYDAVGNAVPDSKLPAKQKYGISFRPRQSMFVDRLSALKITVEYINDILQKDSFADFVSTENLGLVDNIPSNNLNLYDVEVDNEVDLITVVTARIKPAILTTNIVDGEIESVNIIDPGFGYRVPPPVVIEGDGTGAKIEVTLDLKGRVSSATVIRKGKRYSFATLEVRNFSVLVKADSTITGFWSIYAWDNVRKIFFRTQTQAFDTTRYWSLVDWWKAGYSTASRIVKEISMVVQEPTIGVDLGDLIRIKEYGSGGWAVFEKVSDTAVEFLDKYSLVGREKGTIELSSTLYDLDSIGVGYDNRQSFDIGNYDLENFRELRNVLRAVKEDIFVGDYSVEWNNLFFVGIRYIFSEQEYVDWAFKTSFLNAAHNVGLLKQKLNYKGDNLASFQDYIDEVKPYRTTIREYVSKYQSIEQTNTVVTDFDLPAAYSSVEGKIVPITESDETINQYPWKLWKDNQGYSITEILISNPGGDYVQPPTVVITGNGQGASARAYISNGVVTAVVLQDKGQGYTEAPTISLVGGNNNSTNTAKAIAVLGDSKVRNMRIGFKFDRITKTGVYENLVQEETFVASGYDAVFELSYPTTRDKSKIEILKNGSLMLNDEFMISLFEITDGEFVYKKGKVVFYNPPATGDNIVVTYEKDDTLLDSVNRINKYYTPVSGMRGKDIPQLMTGIDFGGVQVQGSSFGIAGGWDALPWFTDNWDSVTPSSDFYYIFSALDYKDTVEYRVGSRVQFGGSIYEMKELPTVGEAPLIGVAPVEGESDLRTPNPLWVTVAIDSTFYPTVVGYSNTRQYFIGDLTLFENKIYKRVENSIVGESPESNPSRWNRISLTSIRLPYVPLEGQQITVYRKLTDVKTVDYDETKTYNFGDLIKFQGRFYRSIFEDPIVGQSPVGSSTRWRQVPDIARVDDLMWGVDDSSTLGNPEALMPTFVGDGDTDEISLTYFETLPGETLIFRPVESDGSINVESSEILDTNLSGGSLVENMSGAFITATGITAEEIVVEGGVFVSPDFVPAPEENVPGQVLDSISLKVFQTTPDDPDRGVSAFEIHKDMLNINYYKRYSLGEYVLANPLNYYDTEMVLVDATGLVTPSPLNNVPGTVYIAGERIEYLHKSGNTLRRLRRGVQGTPIAEQYSAGTPIVDVSYNQTLPYAENQSRVDDFYNIFVLQYDGSTNTFYVDDPIFVGALDVELPDGTSELRANKDNIVIKINDSTLDRTKYEVSTDGTINEIVIDASIELSSTDRIVVYPLLVNVGYVLDVTPSTLADGNSWYRDTIPYGRGYVWDGSQWNDIGLISKQTASQYLQIKGIVADRSDLPVSSNSINDLYVDNTFEGFGQCDQIEVFVGGRRLRRNPIKIYNESSGAYSPESDVDIEAEFSVDGRSRYIRLTAPVENAGTRITVIKRTGKLWYERGITAASRGITLLENNTPVARFIAQKTTDLPE